MKLLARDGKESILQRGSNLFCTHRDMIKKFIQVNQKLCDSFVKRVPSIVWPEYTRSWFGAAVNAELDRLKASGVKFRVLEVGGIDRPFLKKGSGFEYVGMDVEHRPKCDEVYDEFHVQSIEESLAGQFDLIISRMVLEHVPDNEKSWAVIFACLKPGGKAIHIFPSGLHPYSMATRLVGNRLQRKLIGLYRPTAKDITGYPAYYDNCNPSKLEKLLTRKGYSNIDLRVNYSASEYFNFFFPAFVFVALFNFAFYKLGVRLFCSNVYVSAQKPS